MTRFNTFMNQSGRATAGNAAAAASSCPQSRCAGHTAFAMDVAFHAASIFVILFLTCLLWVVSLAVSIFGILVLVCLISLLIMKRPKRSLKRVSPAA